MKHEIDYIEKCELKKNSCNDYSAKFVIGAAVLGLLYGFLKIADVMYPEVHNVVWFQEFVAGLAGSSFATGAGFKMAAIFWGDKVKKYKQSMANKSNNLLEKKIEESIKKSEKKITQREELIEK